jgi:hypothetical protein
MHLRVVVFLLLFTSLCHPFSGLQEGSRVRSFLSSDVSITDFLSMLDRRVPSLHDSRFLGRRLHRPWLSCCS